MNSFAKMDCPHKISLQREVGARVGQSAEAISIMRKAKPVQYRAILIGVLVEQCLGVDKANDLIKAGCSKTSTLPIVWELLY